jgi:hypothetical protein
MSTPAWEPFFIASSGATAALAGLIFVAISINLDDILETPGLDRRALEALALLVGALILSLLVLVPGQPQPPSGSRRGSRGSPSPSSRRARWRSCESGSAVR